MNCYYFYLDQSAQSTYIKKLPVEGITPEFVWLDYTRQEIIHRPEAWQQEIYQQTGLILNEFHIKDIQNLEHPCVFDALDDYNFMIFRKLITPDDQIEWADNQNEKHERVFGLVTTPVSFILTAEVLITVREQGNHALENYLERVKILLERPIDQQNKPRKLAHSPLDLTLRLLNTMIDGYLDLRNPLTRRVEFWQQELLQGHRKFTQWNQLLQENMAFQQVENLCEEQVESLQELRDEIVENYSHLKAKTKAEKQDLMLVRVDDLSNHVERIQKHTVRLREAIQAAIDLHFSAVANQTNENMRILAIITAVFAPLTLLTGIYGMNFEFIPGLKSTNGFWMMLGAMLFTTLILIFYFYRRHLVGRGERSVIDILAQQNKQQQMSLFSFLEYEPIRKTVKGTIKMWKIK